MRTLILATGMVIAVGLLNACDGGKPPEPAAAEPPPGIAAGPSVPSAATATISKVTTPTGSAGWQTRQGISAGPGDARVPVVATNAEGHIVLAAWASSSTVALTPESTALALTRFAYGRVPAGLDSTTLDGAIQASADFTTLVERVSQALALGQAPSASVPVLQSVGVVLGQTTDIVGTQVLANQVLANARAQPLAIAPTRASRSLPLSLVTGLGPLGSVFLRDSNGGIRVTNTLPIEWAAQTYNASGQALAPRMAALPAVSSLHALISTTGWLQVDPVVLPNDGGRGLTLVVEQNDNTRLVNWMAFFVDVVSDFQGPSSGVAPSCAQAVATHLLQGNELTVLFRGPSKDTVINWLLGDNVLSYFESAVKAILAGDACFGAKAGALTEGAPGLLVDKVKFLANLGKVLSDGTENVSKVSLVMKLYWTLVSMGHSVAVGICQSHDGYEWIVDNCAKTFEFGPSTPLLLAPGARLVPEVSALDVNGKRTGVPAGLVYGSLSGPIAVDAITGKVIASSAFGPATLTVSDPAAGGKGQLEVNVVAAQLRPSSAEVKVGETIRFALQDTSGRRIWHNGIDVLWTSSKPQVASLAPVDRAPNSYPDSLDIDAKRPGLTHVQVLNPLDPRGAQWAVLNVKGTAVISLSATPMPATVGTATVVTVRATPDTADATDWPVPRGIVILRDADGTSLCTATIREDGTGICDIRFEQPRGTTTLEADYSGDEFYFLRVRAATLDLSVDKRLVSGQISSNREPVLVGDGVVYTLRVRDQVADATQPAPMGNVKVRNSDGGIVCEASLSATGVGECVVRFAAPARSEPLTLDYAGDMRYAARDGVATLTQAIERNPVRLSISLNPNPVASGSTVEASFNVAPDPDGAFKPRPTLNVALLNSRGGVLCVAKLIDGQGKCSANVYAGTTNDELLTAFYDGDNANEKANASSTLSFLPVTQAEAHYASRSGTVDNVLGVLARGWPINGYIDNQLNVMINAAIEDCNAVSEAKVRTLIQAGSSTAHVNVWGDTPLSIARARCGATHPITVMLGG